MYLRENPLYNLKKQVLKDLIFNAQNPVLWAVSSDSLSSIWGFQIQLALRSCAVGLLVEASAHLWYVRRHSIVWQRVMQRPETYETRKFITVTTTAPLVRISAGTCHHSLSGSESRWTHDQISLPQIRDWLYDWWRSEQQFTLPTDRPNSVSREQWFGSQQLQFVVSR